MIVSVLVSICPEDGKIDSSCFDEAQEFVYSAMEKRFALVNFQFRLVKLSLHNLERVCVMCKVIWGFFLKSQTFFGCLYTSQIVHAVSITCLTSHMKQPCMCKLLSQCIIALAIDFSSRLSYN